MLLGDELELEPVPDRALVGAGPLDDARHRVAEVQGQRLIGAVLLGGSRPTRRPELVSGGFTLAFGLLILYLVNQQTDSALVLSFSLSFIALGATAHAG